MFLLCAFVSEGSGGYLSALVAFHSLSLVILQTLTPDTVAQLLSNPPQAFLSSSILTGLGVYASVLFSKSLNDRRMNASVGLIQLKKSNLDKRRDKEKGLKCS